MGSTDLSAGVSDLAMATDLSNAVHKKNTRNANNDATSNVSVSNNQDLLDLLDLDMTTPSTAPVMGVNLQTDHGNVNNMMNLRGIDLNLGFAGIDNTMSSTIPTNGNDLASMLVGLNVGVGAPSNPVPVMPMGGDINSSNLLGELHPTTATNNVTVVRMSR